MKKLARQQSPGLVLHEQVVDGITAKAHVSNGLTAHYPSANGVRAVGLDVLHPREVNAVFVAERQVAKKVFERVDASLRKQLRALRADAFDHAHFRAEAHGHGLLFISLRPLGCGTRETCAPALRTDRVRDSSSRKGASKHKQRRPGWLVSV